MNEPRPTPRPTPPVRKFDGGTMLLIVVIGFLFLWVINRGCWLLPDHALFFPWHGWGSLFGIWGLISIGLAVWVGIDANRRGMQGLLWGALVFFTNVVGLVVYLLVCSGAAAPTPIGPTSAPAPAPPAGPTHGSCSRCGAGLEADFKVCPNCGSRTEAGCASCGRTLRSEWRVCPYCGAPAEG